MPTSLVQTDKFIFHLTHIRNIPAILKNGILCKNICTSKKMKITDVSHQSIQEVRALIQIPNTDHTLHDCVPMFFGARPPMLYAVLGKGYSQEDMVYALVNWNIIGKPNVWFTDGNASSSRTCYYQSKSDLQHIDFNAAGAFWWHNKGIEFRRKKQAEVLQLGKVNLGDILGFAVYNQKAKDNLQALLDAQSVEKQIFRVSDFYY